MKHVGRCLLLFSAFMWVVTIVSASVTPAHAEINGDCGATFQGVDVDTRDSGKAGDAVDVDEGDVATITFTAPSGGGFASHKIDLEFASFGTTVSNQTDDGDATFTDTVNVKDYSFWGVGLYKVIGKATLTDGSTCDGALLVNVTGRTPFTTVAGATATGATVVGGGLVAGSAFSPVRAYSKSSSKIDDWILGEIEKAPEPGAPPPPTPRPETPMEAEMRAWDSVWDLFFGPFFGPCFFFVIPALLLTGAAMASPSGGGSATAGTFRLKRVPWRPRISVGGLGGGLLAGLGVTVLLQQFAVYPLELSLLIILAVVGLVVGVVLPTLTHTFAVMMVNGKIAGGERRLKEAYGIRDSAPTPPPPTPEEPSGE